MSVKCQTPFLRLACCLLLPRRRESLLYECIHIRRFRHAVLLNDISILLREKKENSTLEILMRRR